MGISRSRNGVRFREIGLYRRVSDMLLSVAKSRSRNWFRVRETSFSGRRSSVAISRSRNGGFSERELCLF